MAVARNRIVIEGTLGTQEVWSSGCNFGTTAGGIVVGNADLLSVAEDMWTWLADTDNSGILRNALSSAGAITSVNAQVFDTSGDLLDQAAYSGTPIVGLGSQTAPYQTAVVFSLKGNSPSARRRGRMYWPLLAPGLSFGRLATPTAPADLASQAGQMLEYGASILGAFGVAGMSPVIYSPTGGYNTVVTTVRVGDVPDTQRRRRDALIENYSTYTL